MLWLTVSFIHFAKPQPDHSFIRTVDSAICRTHQRYLLRGISPHGVPRRNALWVHVVQVASTGTQPLSGFPYSVVLWQVHSRESASRHRCGGTVWSRSRAKLNCRSSSQSPAMPERSDGYRCQVPRSTRYCSLGEVVESRFL